MCSSRDSFAPLAQDGRTTDLSLQTPKQLISHYYKVVMLSLPNLMSTHTLHSYSGLLWTPLRRNASDFPHDHASSLSWQLVLLKREARKYLADLSHRQRLDKLEIIFSAWRQRTPVSQQFANDTASCSVCRISSLPKD